MSEPRMYQHWKAGHDENGNPLRVFVVLDSEGNFYDAIDEGYAGRPAPLRGLVELPEVHCTESEYREWLALSPSGGYYFKSNA